MYVGERKKEKKKKRRKKKPSSLHLAYVCSFICTCMLLLTRVESRVEYGFRKGLSVERELIITTYDIYTYSPLSGYIMCNLKGIM